MKTLNQRPPGHLKKTTGAAAVLLLLTLLLPGAAFADMAANAKIINTATVNYKDAGGNALGPATDSVEVIVNLVTAQPTINAPLPADQTTPSTVTVDYLYTITSNSNGLDNYGLSFATSAVGGGIGGLGTIDTLDANTLASIGSIDLGASTVAVAAAIGATAITVPNDGNNADGAINGIDANVGTNTVVINGDTYTVTSIVDNATGTSTINLAGPGLIAPVIVGDNIFQQRQFILRATPTTTTSGDQYTVTVTIDDGVSGAPPTDATTTTVTLINLSVVKYVANITTGIAGAGATVGPFTTGLGTANVTYYESGVTANAGDVLEYVIAVTNTAGSGTATDVIIQDPVPAFTTLTGNVALDDGSGGGFAVSANTNTDNNDFVESDGTTVYIYAGTGGDDDPAPGGTGFGVGQGGSLPGGTTTYGAFRVTVTP